MQYFSVHFSSVPTIVVRYMYMYDVLVYQVKVLNTLCYR